jgi:hypothetical protein
VDLLHPEVPLPWRRQLRPRRPRPVRPDPLSGGRTGPRMGTFGFAPPPAPGHTRKGASACRRASAASAAEGGPGGPGPWPLA